MPGTVTLTPIGTVRASRTEAVDDNWASETAIIELDATQFGPEALQGLDTFSHAEVIFHFHKVPAEKIVTDARHPRGNNNWPLTGIFAQRGKNRPNLMAVSVCEIIKVDGLKLHVRGLDAIDGTPVLDIKPVMQEFQPRGEIRQPGWATDLMKDYWQQS